MTSSVLLERTDDLLEKIYSLLPSPAPHFLFNETELADCKEQSPLWLEVMDNTPLLDAIHLEPEHWPGLLIESTSSTNVLLAHLRRILFIHFDQIRRGVLRYSNPITASYFFGINDAQANAQWLGPISRLSWYGGTWTDYALDRQRWQSTENPHVRDWQCPDESFTPHLDAIHEHALQRQEQERFAYNWWRKRSDTSFPQTLIYLAEGMSQGFGEEQDVMKRYLSLRAQYPTSLIQLTDEHDNNEKRLHDLQQSLEQQVQNKGFLS